MAKTRERILEKAVELYNSKGWSSTSLNEIAGALEITRGNLTYHFPGKEELLEAICARMWEGIESKRATSRSFPSFENLHREVQLYYDFQQKYAFIFLDSHVLRHPLVADKFREMTSQSIEDFKAGIAFSISIGNMKPEEVPGTYSNLAFVTWMLSFFWLAQQIIRGEKAREDGERMIWALLLPHFTDKGKQALQDFFGPDYLEQLGPAFEMDFKSLVKF